MIKNTSFSGKLNWNNPYSGSGKKTEHDYKMQTSFLTSNSRNHLSLDNTNIQDLYKSENSSFLKIQEKLNAAALDSEAMEK